MTWCFGSEQVDEIGKQDGDAISVWLGCLNFEDLDMHRSPISTTMTYDIQKVLLPPSSSACCTLV